LTEADDRLLQYLGVLCNEKIQSDHMRLLANNRCITINTLLTKRYTERANRFTIFLAMTIDKLEWLEGYFGTLAYQLTTASWSLPLRSEDFGGGLKGLCMVPVSGALRINFRLLGALFHRLDDRHKFTRSGYPKNYVVVAHKP